MTARNYSNTSTEAALSGSITSGDTTFSLTSYSGFPSVPYTAAIDRGTASEEIVLITADSSGTVTATRGYDGTTAKSHSASAQFLHVVVAKDYEEANDHINASAAVHGLAGTVVGTSDTQTLTNKTLTAPTISGPTVTGTATMGSATLSGTINVTGFSALAHGSFSGNITVSGTTGLTGALSGTTATFTGTVGVATATAAGHAVQKSVTDALDTRLDTAEATLAAASASAGNSTLVLRDGSGNFATDAITLTDTPTADGHAARKDYVDSTISARGTWTILVNSLTSYSTPLNTGGFVDLSGYSDLSVTVPTGRVLDLEYTLPRLISRASGTAQVRLAVDGTVLDATEQGATVELTIPVRLTGSVVGTGAAVNIDVQGFSAGSAGQAAGSTSRGPRLRYRIF